MAHQFILTMRDLRRVHPPDKEVLRGINISMYPGAKIGVLGLNGSGKSTLLRIIAGEDDGYQRRVPGHARLHRRLPARRSRGSTPSKDVLGNVTDGVAHTKGLLDRFEEVCNAMGEPDADFDKLLAEQAELQDQIDAVNGWDLDRQLEIAMDALRLAARPTPTSRRSPVVSGAGSRCAGCCCRSPTCCCSTSRRTTSTPSRSRGSSATCRSTTAPSSRSRTTATSSTTSRAGSSSSTAGTASRGKATTRRWLEQKEQRLAQEEKVDETRRRTLARELEWIRMAPRARQAKGKARITAYEQLVAEAEVGRAARTTKLQISIPPGPRLGDLVVEAEQLRKGYGDRLLDRRPLVLAAARRHRRRHRRRTAPARRRCSACSSARSSPTAAR